MEIKSNTFSTNIFRDGMKWLLVPSKIMLDGVCMWPENLSGIRKIAGLFFLVGSVAMLCGEILFIADQGRDDLASIATGFSFVFLVIEMIVRRSTCLIYKDRMVKVINEVCYKFWSSDVVGAEKHRQLSKQSIYLFSYCVVYTTFAFLRSLEGIVVPFLENTLPLLTKFPNDKKHPNFELLYVLESFLIIESPFNICGFDLFACSLMLNCASQFKLLRSFARRELQDRRANKRETLKAIVERHNELIRVCKEVDTIFRNFILAQYLASVAMICLSSFMAVAEPENLRNSLPLVLGHAFLTFMYSFMGENLSNESSRLQDAIYECDWQLWGKDKYIQKDIVMVLIKSQKPIMLSIGGFGYLNYFSFLKLVQFSFSVFTFLNKVMDKQRQTDLH